MTLRGSAHCAYAPAMRNVVVATALLAACAPPRGVPQGESSGGGTSTTSDDITTGPSVGPSTAPPVPETTGVEDSTGAPETDSGTSSASETGSSTDGAAETSTTGSTGPASFCGDGAIDADEECDDGNDIPSDSCTDTCKHATCGDGAVFAGVEPCDDGNDDNTDDCLAGCVLPSCGDGHVWAEHEECDDANDDEHDGCESSCVTHALWSGVAMNVSEAQDLKGWELCFDSKVTAGEFAQAKINCLASNNPLKQFAWVMIGCEGEDEIDGTLDLAAMGPRLEVMASNPPGEPKEINGLWWSYVDGKYFGFAPIGIDPHFSVESPKLSWSSSATGACGPGGLDQPARRVVYVR